MSALFGPAGNCADFYVAGHKHTTEMPAFLSTFGLTAYEYQCGRGVRLSDTTAKDLRAEAEKYHITLSLHAPYYISLASAEPIKRDNSIQYILDSAKAVDKLGGTHIVVHPGGLGGVSREEATAIASHTLQRAQKALDDEGLGHIHICPETMGKINQLGNFEEILEFCKVDERFLPCIDFGHLNSRTHGGLNSKEAFETLLDTMENVIGKERTKQFHAHFSKIEYTEGGEKRHLTFADTTYGPEPAPLMELIAKRNLSPVFICESDNTQTKDAATLLSLYMEAK